MRRTFVHPALRAVAATLLASLALGSVTARAQPGGPVFPMPGAPGTFEPKRVETADESLAQDAAQYARRYGVAFGDAVRRLRAQEESVAMTDRLQDVYRDRLAGVSIEHRPDYRIVVLLTGSTPVPDRTILAGGMAVPIVFRPGAAATRGQVVGAIARHQAAIRLMLPDAQGMGLDPRTGELVLLAQARDADADGDADAFGRLALEAEIAALTGVPVRIRSVDGADMDFAVEGGSRVEGVDPRDGRRYACTTGFVVTDSATTGLAKTGVVTAAHCPDALTYYDPDGRAVPLRFVGQWGVAYQDVQVHVGDIAGRPLFYADTRKSAVRTLTGARRRTSTRAGDAVCHRGETTGYSCSEVRLTDFAPPGDLCAGPCDPVWVAVAGPSCRGGDSGGPVFSGTVAFGIAKGGTYRNGRCGLYYYMSTDYLPTGWSLLLAPAVSPRPAVAMSGRGGPAL